MDKKLTITVHKIAGFSDAQLEKYKRAVALTEIILNSEKFYEELMKLKFTSAKDKSNQEIYNMIMSGAETLEPVEDNEVDVFINMYYKNNKVVGYTMPSTRETWVNSKFFEQYEPEEIGCNLVHEWMHKLGFDHVSAKEHTSVPYAIGYLVERLIKEYLAQPKPKPIPEIPKGENKPEPSPVETEPVPSVEKKLVCKRIWYTFWLKKVCWYE